MSQEENGHTDELRKMMREVYNPPPPTPREEIWARIARELTEPGGQEDPEASDLDRARRRQRRRQGWRPPRALGWTAAAAALLVLGIGIGRTMGPAPGAPVRDALTTGSSVPSRHSPLRRATLEHLVRTEALLAVVKSEGRSGSLDPEVGRWAQGLLTETRLFLDAREATDPALRELMEDLELILAQIVGVARTGSGDEARTRTELNLALESMRDQKILTRLQATS